MDQEEAVVEESAVEESSESSFDMDGAVDQLGEDIFGKSEDDGIEVEELEVEEVEIKAEKEPEKEAEEPPRDAPQSWKKEMREFYNSADPVLQDYIDTRESQMQEGLEKDRGDATLGRNMRDVITPFQHLLDQKGLDGPQAVKHLLEAHNALTVGNSEQKMQILRQLAQSYGVNSQPRSENPEMNDALDRLQRLEEDTNANQQRALQATQARIETEVSAFADQHPLFDDLSDEITKFIQVGYELEEAYDMAVRSSPNHIESEIEKRIKERDETSNAEKEKEAAAAKKAKSVNVRGRNTNKAPTAPLGSMEDTMRDTLREIKSRN